MKKIIFGIIVVISISLFREIELGENIIPDDAIRFRVLANSNSVHDQTVKDKVKSELQSDMYNLLQDQRNIDEARDIIKSNIDRFDKSVSNTLANIDPDTTYTIDFGNHFFPAKTYKGIEYEEGYYESLLVKLGKGAGDNWWCVLFPPLCLLEAEEATDVEYKFFVKELIDKFFK